MYQDKIILGGCMLYVGDCLEVLKTLPDESVQCCVTSPPYLGLRDYQTAKWEGGDPNCNHRQTDRFSDKSGIRKASNQKTIEENNGKGVYYKEICAKCGAKRIDKQIGLEQTPEEYVNKLVDVFREVKRVLKDDGTLWLNLGDSYAGSGKGVSEEKRSKNRQLNYPNKGETYGLKPKDLIGIPWRVAFALQADGWYLRSDIIWAKTNPMPESVKDRPTKSHEYIFLLSKIEHYYYNYEAILESSNWAHEDKRFITGPTSGGKTKTGIYAINKSGAYRKDAKRNKRDVWTISTKPYRGAHYATFPEDLIIPCIKAGSAEDNIVLDPFNGAGTTGVVCVKLGRKYIGIDLNKDYIEMSNARIKDAQQQMRLF